MQWVVYITVFVIFIAGVLLAMGVYISPKDSLKESDVIVAVSGGDTVARTVEAVELYQAGWAPQIIFSGAALDPNSKSNASAMREIAIDQGVPPDVINIEEGADNTRENATRTASLITALEHESAILVTSPYHQRRAYIEFRNQLGPDFEIINRPAPDQKWSKSGWWRSPFGWYITASEIPKVIYALTQSR